MNLPWSEMPSNDRARPTAAPPRRSRRRAERERRATEPRQATDGRTGQRSTSRPGASLGVVATIVALLGGVVLIAAIVLLQRPGSGGSGGPPPTNGSGLVAPSAVVPADLGDSPNLLGSPTAPLRMEVTEDFQCPICARFSNEELRRLIDDFVRPGLLRIETHDVEFLDSGTTESLDAAAAAGCAGEQGRYWEYHDWLYANQHGENKGAFTRPRLDAIASSIELDQDAFAVCMNATAERSKVTAATNAALAAGIHATPTFVVNGGKPISGLPSYDDLASYLRGLLPSPSSASPSS